MDCPKCGLVNPETALRCDCGYDFATQSVKASYIPKIPKTTVAPLASLGDRLGGQILDSLVAAGALILGVALRTVSEGFGEFVMVVAVVFFVGYLLFADGLRRGQSYGKRVMKTAVVDASSGAPCTFGKSFVRNFLLMILGIIDWVFIFGKKRQRLGDKAANTIVIKMAPN